jgi:hypothetical protein
MAVPDPYDVVTASFADEDGAARTPAVLKCGEQSDPLIRSIGERTGAVRSSS